MRSILFATLLVSACTEIADDNVDVGLFAVDTAASGIDVPATARPGEPFTVTVTTLGSGCTTFASTDVLVTDGAATITPYDRYAAPDDPCTRDLAWISHKVTLHFDVPGTRTVRIHVRRSATEEVTLERMVTVAY